jgi:hypothetical protein
LELDGVTGKLSVSANPQGDPAFARTEVPVVYRGGHFEQAGR